VPTRTLTKAQLEEKLIQTEQTVELLQENFADLELAVEDAGWVRLSSQSQREFSREGLRKIALMALMAFLKNPLIHHATEVQAHYVWGQGVNIHCADPGVNQVIQSFLNDRKNKKVLTGHQARFEKEEELQTKANVFIVFFKNPRTGAIQVRSFPFEECIDIIRNPDDAAEPWYYVRQYNRMEFDPTTGTMVNNEGVKEYYPDWLYQPASRPAKIGDAKVMWDTPVYHIAVNKMGDMKFGIPEHYAALDWAMAVKNDMEDYATIRRALARFAFRLTVQQGPKAVQTAKAKLGTTLGPMAGMPERNPPPNPGSMFIAPAGGATLDPIKTAGMQPSPEEGRRLWLMVSSGTGIPETILTGDSSVGNYATSRTLDRPTELKMLTRQQLWSDAYRDILTYVVRASQTSVNGPISTLPQVVESALREATAIVTSGSSVVALGGSQQDVDAALEAADFHINVDFPAILEHDMLPRVQAIVQAATLNGQQTAGTMSDRSLIQLLLRALNVDNADALIDEILPDGAEYFDTEGEAARSANTAAGTTPDATSTPPPSAVGDAGPDQSGIQLRPISEAFMPATPPTPPPPNPNVDEQGVGLDKSGLHKVAPPPPSMRNQKGGATPSPFDPTQVQPMPTGTFTSDQNSQRMNRSTPPRKGGS
jgi:hypothetical protein